MIIMIKVYYNDIGAIAPVHTHTHTRTHTHTHLDTLESLPSKLTDKAFKLAPVHREL